MKPKSTLRYFLLLAGSSLLAITHHAQATDGNWNIDSAGSWSDATKWSSNPLVPGGQSSTVGLNFDITTARIITIDTTSRTVGILNMGDPAGNSAYTLTASGGASLIFDNNASGAQLTRNTSTARETHPVPITLLDDLTIVNNGATAGKNNAFELTGKITGNKKITLNAGNGYVLLGNTANDYSGGFTLNSGATVMTGGNSAAFGTGTVTINGGQITTAFQGAASQPITTTNANVWNGNWTLISDTSAKIITFQGGVTLGATIAATINQTLALTGVVSDGGSGYGLTQSGTGTLSLENTANTYSGPTKINAGALAFNSIVNVNGGNSSLGAPTNSTDGTINIGSSTTTAGTLRYIGSANCSSDRVLNLAATTTGGATLDQSGTGNLTFTSNLQNATTSGNKTLTLQGSTTGVGEISGNIVNGSGGTLLVTKSGSGSWVLSGANTYTGATAVNGGTLRVRTGSGTRNTSALTIANTPGCVFAAQLANANEQWTSSSTLTVGGVNSELQIDYGSTTPTTSTSEDPIKVTNLTVSGPATLKILGNAANFTVGLEYPLINFTGTGPAAAEPYTGLALSLPAGLSGHLKTIANHVVLVIDSNVALSWNSGNGTWDSGTPWVDGSNTPSSFSAGNSVTLGDASGASGNPVISVSGPSVSPGAVVMNSVSRDYTVTGAIAGNGSMAVNAPSRTLTLQGANSYGGVTTINDGVLKIQNPAASALSQTLSGAVILAGPDVKLESDNTTGAPNVLSTTFGAPARPFGSSANIVCTGGTPGTDNNINLTKGAGLVDVGVFYNGADFAWLDTANGFVRAPIYGTDTNTATTMPGANNANLHLSLTSGYSGVAYQLKTLKLSGAGAIDLAYGSATLTIESIIRTGGGTTTISGGNGVRPPGTEIIVRTDGSSDQLIIAGGSSGSIFNSAQIVKSGAGTLTLTGNGVLGTPTLVNGGTFEIGSTGGRINSGAHSGNIFLNTGTTFLFNNSNGTANNGDQTISGVISGGGGLTKSAVRTLTLSGTNTYTGPTTINAGTLQIGSGGANGALSPSSAITNNGTLAFNRSNTITQGTHFASTISGSGNLNKSGTGTLVLSGTNSYTGVTSISGGVVEVSTMTDGGSNSSIGAAPSAAANLVFLGGVATNTLRYVGGTNAVINRAFTTANGSLGGATIESSGLGTLSFSSTPALAYGTNNENRQIILGGTNAGDNTFAKAIGNNGSGATTLTKAGTGKWVLSGTNGYSGGTNVTAGTLTIDGSLADATMNISSGATVNGAGTLTFKVNGTTADQVVNGGTINISGLSVVVNATGAGLTETAYVLVNGATITGTFTGITGAPGYTLDYTTPNQVRLVSLAGGDDYSTWATDNGIAGELFDDDFDNDGISNGVEYALGLNPTTSSQPPGVLSGNTITFSKGADAINNDDVSWIIETSTTLDAGSWTDEVTQLATDNSATIAYTFTPGSPAKKFARLKVVQVP